MKRFTLGLLVAGIGLFILPVHAQNSDDDPLTQSPPASRSTPLPPELREVKAVVDRFGRMWEDEDLSSFDEVVASDEDMIVIGTDAAEYVVGFQAFREAREQQYASYENVEFNSYDQSIQLSQSGEVAWFAETFDLFLIAAGEPVSLEGIRLSGVLEKRDGRWQIVQLHTSVPVQGQAAAY